LLEFFVVVVVTYETDMTDIFRPPWLEGTQTRIAKFRTKKNLKEKNLKRVMVRDGICVSNSFYVVFYPILAPIPNFIQIGRKTEKLKICNNLIG